MGKPYNRIVILVIVIGILYLCSTSKFDSVSCGATEFPDPRLSLSGTVSNKFDKTHESEMSAVIHDKEREPNVPVIDLEKEVFDLDSYNCNQTLVTSNVDTSFSSVTTSSSSRENLTTKFETIRGNVVRNVYDLH